jgi:hypothetical protein
MAVVGSSVRLIDAILRRLLHIETFSTDPRCILRTSLTKTKRQIDLASTTIPAGASLLLIHFWNERMPTIPPQGPDFRWAVNSRKRFIYSLRLLHSWAAEQGYAKKIKAIGGETVLFSDELSTAQQRLLEHLGFELTQYHSPLGRFGEFWENLFTWSLMSTYNPGTLRGKRFWDIQRMDILMPVEKFNDLYGER